MFRQLAALFLPLVPPPAAPQLAAEQVLDFHPLQLSRYLEEAWAVGALNGLPGGMDIPPALPSFADDLDSGIAGFVPAAPLVQVPAGAYPPQLWDHLIYAYFVENTRVYEIFRRVIEEYAYGERLKVPLNDATQRWLRTTEQLFYGAGLPFQINSLQSTIRSDQRAMRRGAYWRLLGLDLNHGTDDNRPYPYMRAPESNMDFTRVFEELLRQVWRAIENITNGIGPNPTDVATIADLARNLFDMLTVRRINGNLAREELWYTATMSWFHLTLSHDTPIVASLQANASSAEERLIKIGERVGLPAHSRSHNYFRLADVASPILRQIETGAFNTPATAALLFNPPIGAVMQEIIAQWSMATGRDLKARAVSVAEPQPVPVRWQGRPIPGPMPATTNGRAPSPRETVST